MAKRADDLIVVKMEEKQEMYEGCGFSKEDWLEDFRRNCQTYRIRKAYWVYEVAFSISADRLMHHGYVANRAKAISLAKSAGEGAVVKEIFVLRRGKFFLPLYSHIPGKIIY